MIKNDDELTRVLLDDELGTVANFALASAFLAKGVIDTSKDIKAQLFKKLDLFYFDVDVLAGTIDMIIDAKNMSNGYVNVYLGRAKDLPTLLGCNKSYFELLQKVANNLSTANDVTNYIFTRVSGGK